MSEVHGIGNCMRMLNLKSAWIYIERASPKQMLTVTLRLILNVKVTPSRSRELCSIRLQALSISYLKVATASIALKRPKNHKLFIKICTYYVLKDLLGGMEEPVCPLHMITLYLL